ncbi:MAG: cytochrome c [Kofleriaceae bacterium]
MMKARALLCAIALVAIAACGKKKSEEAPTGTAAVNTPEPGTKPAEPVGPDPKLVERGRYLTNVMGCGFCHMPVGPNGPDTTRAFAGGLEVTEAFGTWRSPNITPHKGSGIGGWTDEQIITAVREGVRPDGGKLAPIMPYPFYNRLTDDDAKALVAFLRTVPAVDNVVAKSEVKLPHVPVPKPANLPDDTADPVKHGEYLATIMHCTMCHTPLKPDFTPDMSKQFAGGMEFEMPPVFGTGKLYASNITSDPVTGIGKWSAEDIAKAVKTMMRPNGKPILGPMMFYQTGWAQMEEGDIAAVAAYVKQLAPVKNKVKPSMFKPAGPPPGPPADGAAPGAAPTAGEKHGSAQTNEDAAKEFAAR